MRIETMLIPNENKYTRPGVHMNPLFITVHTTSNYSAQANALAHARLQYHGNSRQASWHATCDDQEIIYQSIPWNEVAYHAGDSNGPGNTKSIGIEICVNRDGDFETAKDNAIWLIRHLMDKFNIPLENVVPHKHWSGKNCPREILAEGWDKFIAQIDSKEATKPVVESKKEFKPNPPYVGSYVKKGSKGCTVKLCQLQLGKLIVDGMFGPKTEARVKEFQRKVGIQVDGIIGPISWNELFGYEKEGI